MYIQIFSFIVFLLLILGGFYIWSMKNSFSINWGWFAGLLALFLFLFILLLVGFMLLPGGRSKMYSSSVVKKSGAKDTDKFLIPQNYIKSINTISGDRNLCFYRAVASEEYGSQDEWKKVYNDIFSYAGSLKNFSNFGAENYEDFMNKYKIGEMAEIELSKIVSKIYGKSVFVIIPYGGKKVFIEYNENDSRILTEDDKERVERLFNACKGKNIIKLSFASKHFSTFSLKM